MKESYLPSKEFEAFLLPMPKTRSKNFDIFDFSEEMFDSNKKLGNNAVKTLLPNLCQTANVDKCTNHKGLLQNYFDQI